MSYSDLLRDPRWQRRRLEIMSRADFSCEKCHSATKTLNVHHKEYRKGAKPWEYADHELECLCEDCHEDEHGKTDKQSLILKRRPDFDSDLAYVAHVEDYLLRKAERVGLDYSEKSILSDILQGKYGSRDELRHQPRL